MTPPETSDDAPSDAADQSYERIFADLFARFWRPPPTEAGDPPASSTITPTAD